MTSPLLSPEEAAAYLRMHPSTLSRLTTTGTIPAIRHTTNGRPWYTTTILDDYLSEQVERTAREAQKRKAHALKLARGPQPWQSGLVEVGTSA